MKRIYKVILVILFPEFVAGYYIIKKILDSRKKVEVLQ